MITGEIKNKVDQIWDIFWTAGITNPITILEQMTYLFFMKMIDDSQLRQEKTANIFGNRLSNPTFPEGSWLNPEDGDSAVPVRYDDMRWHTFRDFSADNMFAVVQIPQRDIDRVLSWTLCQPPIEEHFLYSRFL